MEVIEWFDQTGEQIVGRFPKEGSGEIKFGAQLIIRESQAAIFFRDGKGLDVLGPGREEIEEVEDSLREGDPKSIEAEMGDVFFALVNAARFLKIDPEEALRKANQRFSDRFQFMEGKARRQSQSLADMELDEMEKLWQEAKKAPVGPRRKARR